MSRSRVLRRSSALAVLAGLAIAPPAAPADPCLHGPIPGNPDNRVGLCSPTGDSVVVQVIHGGLQLAWNAPARSTTAYVGPVTAKKWLGVADSAVVPTLHITGDYQSFKDRRVELDVLTITDALGFADSLGVVGQQRVTIAWASIHEASTSGAIAGRFDLPIGYNGEPLRFDVPNANPQFPPDTTALAGLRLRIPSGTSVRREDGAIFDVEDFEGWHVWRWGADPTRLDYEAVGEYTKLVDVAAPVNAWPGIVPDARRIVFVDHNVFDGFLYHYAITTYDQGFKRTTGGDLAQKFDSPLEPAHLGPDGQVVLGPTQFAVSYRNPPPATFEPIAAVPNPFRESEALAGHPETEVVQFINAPPRGTLYIWTVAGDLVLQRDHDQATVGTIEWDTRNQAGQKVTSGVYIYKIVDLVSGQQSYGRLAIIR